MQIKYFAYGPNMLEEWLRLPDRVPGARFRFIGSLRGYRLQFHKKGDDGSGKCSLARTNSAGDIVNGVVYEIPDDELDRLDAAGGIGHGYSRDHVPVQFPDGTVMPVLTYVAEPSATDERLKPYDWYHRLILAGAEQHQLPQEYIEFLQSLPSVPDIDPERSARKSAEAVLGGRSRTSPG